MFLIMFAACNCHGHSSKCQYSEQVAQRKLSLDINGKREGGGVCLECQHNTYGINCEKCRPYYYRPEGVPITSRDACRRKCFHICSRYQVLPMVELDFMLCNTDFVLKHGWLT